MRVVAQEIGRHLRRPSDLVARYGGEEFSVILPETPSYSALALATRIWSSIGDLHILHAGLSSVGYLTVSIGTSTTIPDDKQKMVALVEYADKNLYRSKSDGRNRVTG